MATDETTQIIIDNAAAADESVYMKYKQLKKVNKAKLTSYLERLIELQQVEDELSEDLSERKRRHEEAMLEAINAMGDEVACSFCGKKKSEGTNIVTSPAGACICEECVALCGDIFAGRARR
ncbi:MAG: ClpX C4-type zinc finger protein [Lachnospiraceae bacterium]|nr:ClpX C4-type zinc finger protein [Lachnospiraceae bacterium]